MEVKDVDHKEEFISPLIEPTVNISKAVELSPTIIQRFSGILYALLATLLFTISIFVTKQLKIELLHALLPRFLLQSILLIIYMKLIKHYSFYKQSEKQEIFFLLMNVFCAATGFLAFFLAYSYLPLPDLTTVRNTQVIWTAVLTAIIYRERPSIPVILATLLTMIGVICVAQPKFLFNKTYNMTTTNKMSNDDYHQRLIGLSIVLYCSIVMSIMVISNKHLFTKYKTKQSLIQLQFTFVLSFVVITHLFYKYYFLIDGIQSLKNDFLNWRYLCASSICLLQIISSILIQKAVKREHPSVFTITQSSDILFSIILQNVFTSIKSNILSLFGSILVLTSILIVSGFKLINDKKTKKSTTEMQSN
jgi:drug/metabolite transporter (DMT)-like permease